jgi:L-ascorbate metabolism protein UlaG (beta-lactamase superfamily)
MHITKLGQCCLLIETKGKRILTDPGCYTIDAHSALEHIDCILFTHEHQDHYHIASLTHLLEKNPHAQIYANRSVSTLLDNEHIAHTTVHHHDSFMCGEITIVGIGDTHAPLHEHVPLSANIGYFIDHRFWYPGDAFTDPQQSVEILALPVSGPWMKLSEAIDYALTLKPKKVFPVHDTIRFGSSHTLPAALLTSEGIEFTTLNDGDTLEC